MGSKHTRGGMLCSEILNLHLRAGAADEREVEVNLEEIWSTGALFLTEEPIRPLTPLRFVGGGCEFRGRVTAQTLLRGLGYFIEMRFQPGCAWSEQHYRPKHLFNPLVLLADRIFEATLQPPSSPSDGLSPAAFARTATMASFKLNPGPAFCS
jgi:hypothetical protein